MAISLKNKVMARIYLEYVRAVISKRLEYILYGTFFLFIFASVSIQNIIHNIPRSNASDVWNFFFVALRDTEWVIQGTFGLMLVWFSIKTFKSMLASRNNVFSFLKELNILRLRY